MKLGFCFFQHTQNSVQVFVFIGILGLVQIASTDPPRVRRRVMTFISTNVTCLNYRRITIKTARGVIMSLPVHVLNVRFYASSIFVAFSPLGD